MRAVHLRGPGIPRSRNENRRKLRTGPETPPNPPPVPETLSPPLPTLPPPPDAIPPPGRAPPTSSQSRGGLPPQPPALMPLRSPAPSPTQYIPAFRKRCLFFQAVILLLLRQPRRL